MTYRFPAESAATVRTVEAFGFELRADERAVCVACVGPIVATRRVHVLVQLSDEAIVTIEDRYSRAHEVRHDQVVLPRGEHCRCREDAFAGDALERPVEIEDLSAPLPRSAT